MPDVTPPPPTQINPLAGTEMHVTQAAAEVFASMIPPQMRMTQTAVEVWASVAPTVVLPRQRAHILA